MSLYTKTKLILSILGIELTRKEYEQVLARQRAKGFAKYGMYLEEQKDDSLDWRKEALEEAVDLTQYFGKMVIARNNLKNKKND